MAPYPPVDDWSYTEDGKNRDVEEIEFPGMTTLYERFLDTVRADLEELPR
jgi:hypothetical protein